MQFGGAQSTGSEAGCGRDREGEVLGGGAGRHEHWVELRDWPKTSHCTWEAEVRKEAVVAGEATSPKVQEVFFSVFDLGLEGSGAGR